MSVADQLGPGSPSGSGSSSRWGARLEWAAVGALSVALAASPSYVVKYLIDGQLPTDLLEIFLGAAILVALVATRGLVPWRNPYTWPAALLLAAATIEVVVSPSVREALGLWKDYFVEPMLAALVIAALARTRARARLLLAGLGIAGLIAAGANLGNDLALLTQHGFHVLTPPVVIYDSPNAIPLYLVPLDAIALALLLFSDDWRERLACGLFLVVTAAAVLLSFSRAGWIALAAVVVFVALFTAYRWQTVLAVVGVAIVAVVSSPGVRQRILVEFSVGSRHNSASTRIELWRSTLNLLRHHPLTGSGLAGFKQALLPYQVKGYVTGSIYPHDIILNFWVETGLLGLIAFAWLVAAVARTSFGGLRRDRWTRALCIGVLGLLVAVLVHGAVDVPYFKNDQALAFWAILGLQLGLLRGTLVPPGSAPQAPAPQLATTAS
ncbi:MAG TPA: O-antigen ligase family protein [Verrucomicrobiae bacterium]|nr:O-antigen ligase family protein [Verrucomicrobiae bacterium]